MLHSLGSRHCNVFAVTILDGIDYINIMVGTFLYKVKQTSISACLNREEMAPRGRNESSRGGKLSGNTVDYHGKYHGKYEAI